MKNNLQIIFSNLNSRKILQEFLTFGLIGLNALILEILIIFILVRIGIYPEYCRVISIPIAITFTWYFNRRFTFRNKNPKKIKQYSKYFFLILCGITINYSVYIYVLQILVAFEYAFIIALCMGSLSSMLFNFGLSKFIVFKKFY